MFASHTVWVTEGHTAIAHIQNGWNLLWSHVHITQAFPSRPKLWWCIQNQEMQFFWLLNLCLSRSVLCWRCIDTLFKSYKATANIYPSQSPPRGPYNTLQISHCTSVSAILGDCKLTRLFVNNHILHANDISGILSFVSNLFLQWRGHMCWMTISSGDRAPLEGYIERQTRGILSGARRDCRWATVAASVK